MDQFPVPVTTPPVKHRNAVPLIVILIIIIVGLVGFGIWCWFYRPHADVPGSGSHAGGDVSSAGGSGGPCTGGVANTLPAGFTWYESTDYGFKFAYPSAWGTVNVTNTPMGGVGGHYLQGSFSAEANVTFGGNATDYIVQGRDGIPTDNPGYLQASGHFYMVQIWTFRAAGVPDEPKHDLFPITEAATLKNGCNAKALVSQYPANELIDYSYDLARFNLQPTNAYYGVNFVLKNPDATARTTFDKLIGTFQLIP